MVKPSNHVVATRHYEKATQLKGATGSSPRRQHGAQTVVPKTHLLAEGVAGRALRCRSELTDVGAALLPRIYPLE